MRHGHTLPLPLLPLLLVLLFLLLLPLLLLGFCASAWLLRICLCKCVSAVAYGPHLADFCGFGVGAERRSRSGCRTAASWCGRASSSARHSTTSEPRTATPPPWPCEAPAKTSNPETTAHTNKRHVRAAKGQQG